MESKNLKKSDFVMELDKIRKMKEEKTLYTYHFKHYSHIPCDEDVLLKQAFIQLIADVPIQDLKKVFKFEKQIGYNGEIDYIVSTKI